MQNQLQMVVMLIKGTKGYFCQIEVGRYDYRTCNPPSSSILLKNIPHLASKDKISTLINAHLPVAADHAC